MNSLVEGFVKLYFSLGLSQKEILSCLAEVNGIILSKSSLKRLLRKAGLYRRKEFSDILSVSLFLVGELQTSNQLHGYKLMHLKCVQAGYVVTQETVRLLLQILDPRGVSVRKTGTIKRRLYVGKGPNFNWHMDSYDKLKHYGICANGCIDGFSRYVVWLRVYSTSSNPRIIAGYFIDTLATTGGCPARIRADFGTENGHVKQIQEALRFDHSDQFARKSFMYGTSTHNQRIESWWAFLRRHCTQYWIERFQNLKEMDLFTGDFIDKNLIQFVFLNIIQKEFDEVVSLWNTHRIRPIRNQTGPYGRPVMMYMFPHLHNTANFLEHVDDGAIRLCRQDTLQAGPYPCDKDVFDLCCIIIAEKALSTPTCPQEGFELYEVLREEIRSNL